MRKKEEKEAAAVVERTRARTMVRKVVNFGTTKRANEMRENGALQSRCILLVGCYFCVAASLTAHQLINIRLRKISHTTTRRRCKRFYRVII